MTYNLIVKLYMYVNSNFSNSALTPRNQNALKIRTNAEKYLLNLQPLCKISLTNNFLKLQYLFKKKKSVLQRLYYWCC